MWMRETTIKGSRKTLMCFRSEDEDRHMPPLASRDVAGLHQQQKIAVVSLRVSVLQRSNDDCEQF